MNAKDIFGLIVRTIGLVILLSGLYWTVWGMQTAFFPADNEEFPALHYFTAGLPEVAAGLLLLFGARWIVDWSY